MKHQGSLEYLIIIAAVLAVAAIVVLFLTGGLSSANRQALINNCKQAASKCANLMATSDIEMCDYSENSECYKACVVDGKDVMTGLPYPDYYYGLYYCALGKPENISYYEPSQGSPTPPLPGLPPEVKPPGGEIGGISPR